MLRRPQPLDSLADLVAACLTSVRDYTKVPKQMDAQFETLAPDRSWVQQVWAFADSS